MTRTVRVAAVVVVFIAIAIFAPDYFATPHT